MSRRFWSLFFLIAFWSCSDSASEQAPRAVGGSTGGQGGQGGALEAATGGASPDGQGGALEAATGGASPGGQGGALEAATGGQAHSEGGSGGGTLAGGTSSIEAGTAGVRIEGGASGDVLFPETEHWGMAAPYRSADAMVVKVQRKDQRTICYLEKSGWLECLDTVTQSGWHYQPFAGTVEDFAVSPQGELVVAERVPSPVREKNFLSLSWLDANGQPSTSKTLLAPVVASDLVWYDVLADGQINTGTLNESEASFENQPFLVESIGWRRRTLVHLKWIGDELYLLAYTYSGLSVYRLTRDFDVGWRAPVMPALLMSIVLDRKAVLIEGPDRQVLVAFDMAEVEDQVFEQHFGRVLDKHVVGQDIALAAFTDKGEFEALTFWGREDEREYLADAMQGTDRLWVAANIRKQKYDRPNDTTEFDIVLMALDLARGQVDKHAVLDCKDEDFALTLAAMPSGNLLIAGRTGYLQVDTNSEVSFGSGLLLEVSPQGQRLRSAVLTGPRDVGVMSAAPLDNNHVLFAGWHDAPVTHTCEGDSSDACSRVSGMVGLTELAENEFCK